MTDEHLSGVDTPGENDTGGGEARRTADTKRMLLFSVAVLVVAGLGAYLLFTLRPGPERTEVAAEPPLVEVLEVRPQQERLTVFSQGTVRPVTESTLAAQVAGRVVSVSPRLREGAFFSRGETLVTIDPSDYRLALESSEAAVEQARSRLERIRAEAEVARVEIDLLDAGDEASPLARYEPQLAEAKASLSAAEASRERARLDLSRTTIEAPYDGRVRARLVDVGQTVAPGTPVAQIFATDAAEVRLPVSKEDAGYLPERVAFAGEPPEGSRVLLHGELGGTLQQWTGRIVRIGGEIDPRTRMLPLFAEVDDPYRREPGSVGPILPMGLFVEAEIPGRVLEDVYVVPRAALSPNRDLRVVGIDDRLQIRPVEIVRSTADRVVVRAGLDPGDRVVVSRLEEVTDGMEVRVDDSGADGTVPAEAPELRDAGRDERNGNGEDDAP